MASRIRRSKAWKNHSRSKRIPMIPVVPKSRIRQERYSRPGNSYKRVFGGNEMLGTLTSHLWIFLALISVILLVYYILRGYGYV